MLLPFRCHLPVSGLPQPTGQAFVQSHTFPTDSRRKVFVYWNDDKGQVIGRIILSLLIFVFGDRNWRPPPTYVITELQISLDLRKLILTGNNPDGPSSCCCKFLVVFSLPVSSAVRCRVLCRKTIGVVSNYTDDGIDRSLFIYCDSDRFLQRESKLIEKMA